MNTFKALAAIVTAALISVSCNAQSSGKKSQESPSRQIAKAASYKDFSGIDYASGKQISLSSYVKGKVAVVDFWASWCGPCRNEIKNTLIPLYEKYKADTSVVIVGVDVSDTAEDHRSATELLGIRYPQIIDSKEEGALLYNLQSIPFIIVIGKDGTLAATNVRGDAIGKAVESLLGK